MARRSAITETIEQRRERLDTVIAAIEATRLKIQSCVDCGLPMQKRLEENEAQYKLATAMRDKIFGPLQSVT